MKKVLISLAIAVSIAACHEGDKVQDSKINPGVGHEIPSSLAYKWIQNKTGSSNGRDVVYDGKVSAENLELLIKSVYNPIGVAFHYGDKSGEETITLVPVDMSQRLSYNSPVIDVSTDEIIDPADAKMWTDKFKSDHPDDIWYHFFGINVINEIISNNNFNYLNVAKAINDEGKPQMILLVYNNKNAAGRANDDEPNEGSEPKTYDASNPCPPCCCQ